MGELRLNDGWLRLGLKPFSPKLRRKHGLKVAVPWAVQPEVTMVTSAAMSPNRKRAEAELRVMGGKAFGVVIDLEMGKRGETGDRAVSEEAPRSRKPLLPRGELFSPSMATRT